MSTITIGHLQKDVINNKSHRKNFILEDRSSNVEDDDDDDVGTVIENENDNYQIESDTSFDEYYETCLREFSS